ncbi:uncharacterized protein LOC129589776 [Paramacrobiotus metropolitanus]|uniref:uncharacterized protein LOC129589776 n=1 Tax=Paramacrobiotus metropolitanus TaxID=2943436 RepID=UPI002445D275|nr:uncharacterized protein LOC129589776 [Paramacrobiotus metropolitanus]
MDSKILIALLGCLCVAYAAKADPKPVDKATEKMAKDAFMALDKKGMPRQAKCGMSFQKVIYKTYQKEETRGGTKYYFEVDLQFRGPAAGSKGPDFVRNKKMVVTVPKGNGNPTVDVSPCE